MSLVQKHFHINHVLINLMWKKSIRLQILFKNIISRLWFTFKNELDNVSENLPLLGWKREDILFKSASKLDVDFWIHEDFWYLKSTEALSYKPLWFFSPKYYFRLRRLVFGFLFSSKAKDSTFGLYLKNSKCTGEKNLRKSHKKCFMLILLKRKIQWKMIAW